MRGSKTDRWIVPVAALIVLLSAAFPNARFI